MSEEYPYCSCLPCTITRAGRDAALKEMTARIWRRASAELKMHVAAQQASLSEASLSSLRRRIYIIGSLRDPYVVSLAQRLRADGHEVHDDWYSAGPEADDAWQRHYTAKGIGFPAALKGAHAQCVLAEDSKWLMWADTVIMVDAGKSRGIEFGWRVGQGAQGFIFLTEGAPERWDIMYAYATDVVYDQAALLDALERTGR